MTDYVCRITAYLEGGGMVMPPLLLASLVMWSLIVNRLLFFRRLHRRNMPRRIAGEHIRDNTPPDGNRHRGVVALLVAEFQQRRTGDAELDRWILDETVFSLANSLNRHLAVIGVLAAIAPLLGLLGTVIGMITTFDIIAVFGTGNVRAMSGGVSEALVTTQTGLLIAIPGLYMRSLLENRARILKQRIARVGMYLKRYV